MNKFKTMNIFSHTAERLCPYGDYASRLVTF